MDTVEFFEESHGLLSDKVAVLQESLAISEEEKANITNVRLL